MFTFLRICAASFLLFIANPSFAATRTEIILPDAEASTLPIAAGVATDSMVYVSGYLGFDPQSKKLGQGIEEQTQFALASIKEVLEAAGSSMEKVVKVTVFMTDLNQFKGMNSVYTQYFTKNFPARSTVKVAGLLFDAAIEIEVIAIK